MREELINTFLYDLIRKNYKKQLSYDAAKLALESDYLTMQQLADQLGVPFGTVRSRIHVACRALDVGGVGLIHLRIAYTRFLEDELELLEGDYSEP